MAGKPQRGLTARAFLQRTGPGRSVRVYRDKEVIYSQGQSADAIFYVKSGMVKLTMAAKSRRKHALLAILREGAIFGEGCLFRTARRMSTATAIGPSTITRVDGGVFRDRLDRDPALAALVIRCLIVQAVRFKADLADQRLNPVERRLVRILLMYSRMTRKSKSGASTLLFGQNTLAEIVGTTRSRVNSFMNKFRAKGYLRYNGSLEIDTERLTALLHR